MSHRTMYDCDVVDCPECPPLVPIVRTSVEELRAQYPDPASNTRTLAAAKFAETYKYVLHESSRCGLYRAHLAGQDMKAAEAAKTIELRDAEIKTLRNQVVTQAAALESKCHVQMMVARLLATPPVVIQEMWCDAPETMQRLVDILEIEIARREKEKGKNQS